MFSLSLFGCFLTIWETETKKVMESKVAWVASSLVCWGVIRPSPRNAPDFKLEFRWLGLESRLWAWKVKKGQLYWLESRYWEPKMPQLETGDGLRQIGGQEHQVHIPITLGINLIRALTALRIKCWKWQAATRHLIYSWQPFTCVQYYTRQQSVAQAGVPFSLPTHVH